MRKSSVVVATTKVRIFKQITTLWKVKLFTYLLLLLPQRYVFSSKSQPVLDMYSIHQSCCCYHKGTYFQANHNLSGWRLLALYVVVATTKVRIFKQITTMVMVTGKILLLLLLPQRYVFSSKSQHDAVSKSEPPSCCCYHKGTYFQANHNPIPLNLSRIHVVVATTKVRIFKQITTKEVDEDLLPLLLLLPQRYVFSSKSQHVLVNGRIKIGCCCYHKGTYFQANHNTSPICLMTYCVVVATTKVRIFKQITTWCCRPRVYL